MTTDSSSFLQQYFASTSSFFISLTEYIFFDTILGHTSNETCHICRDPESYADGKHHGESQECVALVKNACGAPQTARWAKGTQVKGNSITKGTDIASFEGSNGGYEGHAAIYLSQDSTGIQVVDQWKGHGTSKRTIRFGGSGVSNDGDKFYAIN